MKQGTITIYWELKNDFIDVGVEMSPETRRLPRVYKQRVITRLREILMPSKKEVLPQ